MKKQGKEEHAALTVRGGKRGLDLPRPLLCLPNGLSEVPAAPSLAIGCTKQALNASSWSKLPEKLNPNWSIVSQQLKNHLFPQENKTFVKNNSPQF